MKRAAALGVAVLAVAGCDGSPSSAPAPGTPTSLACEPIEYPVPAGALAELDVPGPAYDWQGAWQSCEVLFPSRAQGSALYGVLFAPQSLDPATDRLPAIVIAPGSGVGLQAQYHYAARDLAGHGYIVLTVDPQGVGRSELVGNPQTADNYVDAVASALDYLESAANPLQAAVDTSRLGAAGHSLSARAVSWLQGEDPRIKAIVAWDNLSSTLAGDAGISSGGGAGGAVIGGELPGGDPRPATVRVPAMGQASDRPGSTTQDTDPDVKKTGYSVWREAGLPAMQLVYLDFAHADWSQTSTVSEDPEAARPRQLRLIAHHTRAWFDHWLRQDPTALERLTARSVAGYSFEQMFSVQFRSALYLPALGIDCADILAGDCPAFAAP